MIISRTKLTSKLKLISKVFFIILLINPIAVKATDVKNPKTNPIENTASAERSLVLNNRLVELKDTDKSNLTRADKKQLRNEVQSIKKELAELDGGVYISVGAVIIILLLLIIFL